MRLRADDAAVHAPRLSPVARALRAGELYRSLMEEEENERAAEATRAARARQQQREWRHKQGAGGYGNGSRGYGGGYGGGYDRHDGGYGGHGGYGGGHEAPRQPQRARAASTGEDALRQRAARLPQGDVRRVLTARTHYDVLGLPRGARAAEAKKAFHKLALKLHPDKCSQPLSEEAFKRVEAAHRTLTDAALRAEYDLTLPAW